MHVEICSPLTGRLCDALVFPWVGLEEAAVGTTHRPRFRDSSRNREDTPALSPLEPGGPALGLSVMEGYSAGSPHPAESLRPCHRAPCWCLGEPLLSQCRLPWCLCFHHLRVTLQGKRKVLLYIRHPPWMGSDDRDTCSPDSVQPVNHYGAEDKTHGRGKRNHLSQWYSSDDAC